MNVSGAISKAAICCLNDPLDKNSIPADTRLRVLPETLLHAKEFKKLNREALMQSCLKSIDLISAEKCSSSCSVELELKLNLDATKRRNWSEAIY